MICIMRKIFIIIIAFFFFEVSSYYSEFDNLLLPRKNAMSNTGYTFSESEDLLFLNPAGLGFHHYEENYLSVLYGGIINYLIPEYAEATYKRFNIIYKSGIPNIGGFGFDISHFSYVYTQDKNDIVCTIRDITIPNKCRYICNKYGIFHLPDLLILCGWGHDLSFINLDRHSFGMTVNYLSYPINIRFTTFDIGYLYETPFKLRAGITIKNLLQIRSKELNDIDKITLPRIISIAIGYINDIPMHKKIDILCIAAEVNGNIFFRKRKALRLLCDTSGAYSPSIHTYSDDYASYGRLNMGSEITIFNSCFFRVGFMYNSQFDEYDFHYGFGAAFFNHLNFNIFKNYGSRSITDHYQFVISLVNLLKWKKKDLKWWLK